MASSLRSSGKRGRECCSSSSSAAAAVARPESSCPVCFLEFDAEGRAEDAHSVASFPCGHLVCRACDEKMSHRGFHACPLCRTPREGFSQDDVNLATEARVRADAEIAQPAHVVFLHFERQNGAGQTIFFPNQSQGDPFAILRAEGGSHVDAMRRIRHSSPSDENVEPQRRSASAAAAAAAAAAELIGDSMYQLIARDLLQPTDLSRFLAHHRDITTRNQFPT